MNSLQPPISHNTETRCKPDHTPVKTPAKRERLETTIFDTNFFSDSRIEEIEDRFGDAAPAYYQKIAFQIEREGGPIRFNGAVAILKKKQIGERAEEFLNACIEIGLFYRDGALISSHRADREIAKVKDQRDEWRTKKRHQRESPKCPQGVPILSQGTLGGLPGESPELSEEGRRKKEEGTRKEELGKEEGCGEKPEPPAPEDPDGFKAHAKAALIPEKALDERLRGIFMSCGRQPMKKYPEILITQPELIHTFETYKAAGVPLGEFKLGFRKVQTWVKNQQAQGRNGFSAASALTGWALQEVLKELKARNDLKRSEKYLEKAAQ